MDDPEEYRPEARIEERRSDDLVKILLATDLHIGVWERDPVRGQDSINTFREILQLATIHDVDFILMAGDLFHENRPSRESLYQTLGLLREYTLGDKPVSLELMSDPDDGKAPGYNFPAINYEDTNLNVSIPVFSIHGNHDDPQGAAGPDGALCALDVLAVTGLINYMGKIDLPYSDQDAASTGIAIRPVLLRKGTTRLALYGVGNVKDQRMHFELRSNRVRMLTPRDKDDWFNVMLLHQNRVRRGHVECVPEGMFDDSIDLIVWGHEHDCRINPEPVAGKPYYITQPGSTVATSLSEGESLTKHCALLEIQDKSFEITPIALRTVRPFKMGDVHLALEAEEEGIDLNDRVEINKYLKRKVNELIEEANQEFQERNADSDEPVAPMLPLIRLRVDTTGVPEMSNPVRFGQEFLNKIANPRDVLSFTRAKKTATGKGKGKVTIDMPEAEMDTNLTYKERVEKVRVGQLVEEYLGAQELQLLGVKGMSDAIEIFVDKEDNHAISTFVDGSMKAMKSGMKLNDDEVNEARLEDALATAREAYEKDYAIDKDKFTSKSKKNKKAAEDSDADSMLLDDDDPPAPTKRKTATSTARTAAATKTKAPPKPRAAKGKGKKNVLEDSDEEEEIAMDLDENEDDDDDEEEIIPAKTKAAAKPRATARATSSAPKKAPAKPPATRAPARKKATGTQSTLSFAPSRSKVKPIELDEDSSD